MSDTIRWGILGSGSIAKKFATGLQVLPDAQIAAVGSRAQATADAFADEFNIPRRHASYEALAADPDIDAIYISTPHTFHSENSILCLDAGKAVLCEKPFALNAAQAARTIECARRNKVFLMEAMWTRFLPIWVQVRDWLASGAIGEIRMMSADFGFRAEWNPESRLLNPALGGGALLDVGVYTVSLASMIMGGAPEQIASLSHIGETGVDEQTALILGYSGGRLASLQSAVRTMTAHEATILGEDGRIRVPRHFWQGAEATLYRDNDPEKTISAPLTGNGYNYQAAEVMQCLREGKLESEIMPLDETLSIMETLDAIRAQSGLVYPDEK